MTETNSILTPDQPSDRERAIVACGLLIDTLTELQPNVQEIKDRWYQTGLCIRAALAEIRTADARAAGQLAHTTQSEYLGI
jgi:hypothetical protein